MKMKLYRLSLKEFDQSDFFRTIVSREDWIRAFFSQEHEFMHRGTRFFFRPETSVQIPGGYLFGWLARERTLLERSPPHEGLELKVHEHWQASFVVIDPSDHEDGQKIAVEDNDQVGKPLAIFQTLVKLMTSDRKFGYSAQLYAVVEESSFWMFAAEHDNRIRSITFDVAAPNMFKSASDFQDELRVLRDTANVSNVKATLESDTSLDHTAQPIKEIVEYTEKGAGSLSATASDGQTYNSDQHEKSINLPVEHHSKGVAAFLEQVAGIIKKVF